MSDRQGGRLRIRRACSQCRRRKRRCNGDNPCSMCIRYDYTCRYNDEQPLPSSNLADAEINEEPPSAEARPPFVTAQAAPLNETKTPFEYRGVLDPLKERYMRQNSAIAFANELGRQLHSGFPPRLHSFAWNCGIRPEEPSTSHTPLTQLVSRNECRKYSNIFFSIVHPSFAFLDKQLYVDQCEQLWTNPSSNIVLGAVIGSVIALGSIFAFRDGHPREVQIVLHVKAVLEDPHVARRPSLEHVKAWLLRTLYLRATTRPCLAWLASCITMHLAEAIGLHRNAKQEVLTNQVSSEAKHEEEKKKTFWVAWFVTIIISYEYGRMRNFLDHVSCPDYLFEEHSETAVQLHMARLVPDEQSGNIKVTKAALETTLKALHELDSVEGYLALCRADICFCIYRRLRLLRYNLDSEDVSIITSIGNRAVETAVNLAQRGIPWWNLLNTTFQFFCVLLAIDESDSLSLTHTIFSSLETIVMILDTHVAHEALETARSLLHDAVLKKRNDLSLIENVTGIAGNIPSSNWQMQPSSPLGDIHDNENLWLMGIDDLADFGHASHGVP